MDYYRAISWQNMKNVRAGIWYFAKNKRSNFDVTPREVPFFFNLYFFLLSWEKSFKMHFIWCLYVNQKRSYGLQTKVVSATFVDPMLLSRKVMKVPLWYFHTSMDQYRTTLWQNMKEIRSGIGYVANKKRSNFDVTPREVPFFFNLYLFLLSWEKSFKMHFSWCLYVN